MSTNATDVRLALVARGYTPVPLHGKIPSLKTWQALENVNREQIAMWAKSWPDARNTGVLTGDTPTLDLDILNEEAARAAEDLVRERFEERGYILPRIGLAPKRAILFRTIEPFGKILINLLGANGSREKIEFLGHGQQVVVDGIHPNTGKAYAWHGGDPMQIAHDDLPYISEAEAQALVTDIATLLVREFGYTPAKNRPRARAGNSAAAQAEVSRGADDWQHLTDNIRTGQALHDSLCALAAKLIASGMQAGAAVNYLRALMDGGSCPHDERWQERRSEIPRLVDSAEAKFRQPQEPEQPAAATPDKASPSTITETLAAFERWLLLPDPTPVYAVLGAVAANLLPGDPVWLGLVGPPSSAKTEILNSISLLPKVVQTATLTVAGLLSGTPKKQYTGGAKGGLLRQIGDFGIISLKDFGSILSMHPETKAEVLAALREIYDGAWTRHLGSDGGRTLAWKGKVGLVFGSTGVIDSHYSVIGALGDRFILNRLAPAGRGQFDRALKHKGAATGQMRKELAEAVARLFEGRQLEPRPITDEEVQFIDNVIMLAVRLRGAIARDRQSREIEAVYGAEGTARIGLALERLLAGLDTLGIERGLALKVVKDVGLDLVPPGRRSAYEYLHALHQDGKEAASTTAVAQVLALPTTTTRRILEELTAYGLIERRPQGQGKADLWALTNWQAEI